LFRAICTYSTVQLGALDDDGDGDADLELDLVELEDDDDDHLLLDDELTTTELAELDDEDLARFLKLYDTAGDNVIANTTKARVRLRSLI
jgi:hypothetical protein